ncbi:riboflavin biosynthesis protein RibD [Alicyclobacillus contaminans]|uniref:bifunctional diaminohydroxyphosphoribosylaminopyrimidine deaminase/5-amino-6-(5-phosphoribosylamino)uracil reductase RibD n=1 Tax=Alicyclobacillus contaminans TaxID=392016 RepID=UPI0004005573|nr:bifunctional diaminohydroxyphosphoribosylaminopyrimidine deaminase/5-amino-6-(5-phosphoribosylamino)uracil reductase RibD [Alicyclobacillus contaminans]GMA51543.1 riboflavin biosynthesis protein RibD [Alicyclobacillus contaminans]
MNDEQWMRMALRLAEAGQGQTAPNPVVGAVVVQQGEVVGFGAHLKAGTPHAEVHALRMAGHRAAHATVYVTLEPCSHHGRTPPCCDALIEAGVSRVVVALTDPNPAVSGAGIQRLREAGITVDVGVLAAEAARQNAAYLTWRRWSRPLVIWKCAATLDGRIAAPTGHSQYVTGPAARAEVQSLRRQVAAIAVGIGTVLADNPRLTVRSDSEVPAHQPCRVVFDSTLRMPADAVLLRQPGEVLVYCTAAARDTYPQRAAALEAAGAELVPVAADEAGRVRVEDALADLGRRGLTSLLVEGGQALVSSLLAQGMVDKVVYYVAPKLLGQGISALSGPVPASMGEAMQLKDVEWGVVGEDLRVTGWLRHPWEREEETACSQDS